MLKFIRLGIGLAVVLALLTGKKAQAQDNGVPPLSNSLAQWQVQGEYFGAVTGGGTLGAWLIANGANSYTVVFLPGGLLTLPDQPYGGWSKTGWSRNSFSGIATLVGTTYVVNTPSLYKASTITGTGETRVITGTTPGGTTFTLNRVKRNSPTHSLKPDAAWGTVNRWFDSATGAADLAKWRSAPVAPNLERGQLACGVREVKGQMGGFLHIEFQGPFTPLERGQGRANSGVYLQGYYECQVLDSFGSNGTQDEFGGIYSVKDPIINASLPPLTWHTYDVYFTPRTSGAANDVLGAAVMTVYANGVLVQAAVPITGPTTSPQNGNLLLPGGLYLQDHGGNVIFRNIWFVPNATPTSLPYTEVLRVAKGSVNINRHSLQPLAENESMGELLLKGQFDLSGRKIENLKVKAVPQIIFNK